MEKCQDLHKTQEQVKGREKKISYYDIFEFLFLNKWESGKKMEERK